MKNVLHLTETSEPGGSETILAYLAKNLDQRHYRSLVGLIREGWLSVHLEKIGVKYLILENNRPFDPVFLSKLVGLIKRERIDLIHTHEFFMNVYGTLAARIARIPVITTVHGKAYFTERSRRIFAYKISLALCSQMVAVSKDLKKYMAENLNLKKHDKILIIYNGIDLSKFAMESSTPIVSNQATAPPKTLVVGTVGSLFKVKGLEHLMEASRRVANCCPNYRLLIVGEGNEEYMIRRKMISLGLEDTVKFLGFRNDIPQLLNIIDIYVCSSLSEGLSLSILEAMAAGKPIVATRVGGNPELVLDGQSGFLVPAKDPRALAEKILVLLKNKELRESMGRKGREIVERKFTVEKMIENYQNLYEKLLS